MEKIILVYGDVKLNIEYEINDRQDREMEVQSITDHDGISVYDYYADINKIEDIETEIFETLDNIDYLDFIGRH